MRTLATLMWTPATVLRTLILAAALALPLLAAPQRAAAAEEAPAPAQAGYDGGFFLRSADGRGAFVIEGLFQFDGAVYDDVRDPRSDFILRRMRPEFAGRFAGFLLFRLEPNFNEDGVELEEAWIGASLLGERATLMLGRMKAPFSLEEVRSRRHIDFPRFSILNQFVPAEDHGAFFYGMTSSRIFEYNVAVFNGTGGADTNGSKDVAGRMMVHPFARRPRSPWRNLQIGLAATTGNQLTDVGGDEIKNEASQPVVRYVPALALDGSRDRLGAEAAWFHGPWFVQSEYMLIGQEMATTPGLRQEVRFHGGYLTVSRVLTGESKTFRGVVPREPFDPASGRGRGAFVLAARYSDLFLDDDLHTFGFVEPGTFTPRIQTLSVTLNWIANTHMIVRNALIGTSYDDAVEIGGQSTSSELAFLCEVQLHF